MGLKMCFFTLSAEPGKLNLLFTHEGVIAPELTRPVDFMWRTAFITRAA